MKKLIIAVFAICAAVAAQAAAANWKATASNLYAGNATDKFTGTAYIFEAGTMSQAALFALFDAGTAIGTSTAGYAGSATIASGTMGQTNFTFGEQSTAETTQNYSFYFVVVNSDDIYFSNEKPMAANGTATSKNVGFGTQASASMFSNQAAGEGFHGAGHWSTHASSGGGEPVPEPTSGLLILLGMAGLALKRKRA